MKRITSNNVHGYVEWLHGSGFDLGSSNDIDGIHITNRTGDTRLSITGKPREIMNHFLKGYIAGWEAAQKEKNDESISQ
jgi:hypothetical protein|tara:strand:+ start:693 stop:929 length:237 start_codon:yes stop_codon:yes gene_type:complete